VTAIAPIATQNPWLMPLPSPAPPHSERLIRALEAHAAAEAHDSTECERLVDRTADPVLRLLLELILGDEQRHHALLQRMVRRLQEEVEFNPSPTALPVSSDDALPEDEAAAATVRALIRDEHEGARYLRHLARQEPKLYGGLYAVLLETMARDGEKHAYMLRYLLRRLEAQAS
jgi:rubrerythrin